MSDVQIRRDRGDLAAVTDAPPIHGHSAAEISGLDALVTKFLTDNNLAGVEVAASKHGRLIVNKSYGHANATEGRPLEPWHRISIGSVSKLATCLAAMKLIEDGRLSLTTPVYTIHSGTLRARHGLTGDEYQQEFDRNKADGFRLVQVSGYGDGAGTRYAAIWEKRLGPALRARHGLTGDEYQQEFDRNKADGFRLVQVSGYGDGAGTRYAAIWEKRPGPALRARHGLTGDEYQQEFDRNKADGFRLVHVSGYGDGAGTRYAAIWEKRPGPALRARHGLTGDEYQQEFDRNKADGFRLVHVSGYGDGAGTRYAAIWEKRPGPALRARHGLTSDEYQQEFDRNYGDGFRLVHVSGYGDGAGTRYAAIWARDPGVEPGVLRDRAYTQALIDRVKLDPDVPADKVQSETRRVLTWAKDLQVIHLLSHTSGLIRNGDVEKAAKFLGIEVEDMTYREVHLGVLSGAVSTDGPFLSAPGTVRKYSNHGFGLAGYITETVAGMPYEEYVRKAILLPAGLDHVVPHGPAPGRRDAAQHRLVNGTPTPIPHTTKPGARLRIAAGGWVATAEDLVRLMCSLDRSPAIPDVLDRGTVDVMETVPFPHVDRDQPLGWDQRVARGASASLAKDGALSVGGCAYVRRFLPGFKSTTGVDLSDINVAVCVNQSDDTEKLKELADEIARRCGAAAVAEEYDLFAGS